MTPQERSDKIKTAAMASGFDRCGITKAEPIARQGFLADWLAKGYAGTMGYLHRHQASRLDVRAWLPWARSVVVVAMNYGRKHQCPETPKYRNVETQNTKDIDPQNSSKREARNCRTVEAPEWHDPGQASSDPERRDTMSAAPTVSAALTGEMSNSNPQSSIPTPQSPERARGRVAMYAWGEDYHAVVRAKLDGLVDQMRTMFKTPLKAQTCVDTSAIIERELAAAAGIGWIGKNTMIVHPSLGSFFVLGEIITDLELSPDSPMPDRCGRCTRCLEACPTGALLQAYEMDARRCISYLTIEHRAEIDPDLASGMDNWVFGCDACQTACPYNRRVAHGNIEHFHGEPSVTAPLLEDILSWDDAACEAFVRGKATRRAKLHMWKRNASIAMRNIQRGK